jgi:hypothetical protein
MQESSNLCRLTRRLRHRFGARGFGLFMSHLATVELPNYTIASLWSTPKRRLPAWQVKLWRQVLTSEARRLDVPTESPVLYHIQGKEQQ